MYKVHPDFISPENEDQIIWRYMNVSKFYHLIQTQSLYFSAACQFQDRFEGSYTKKTMEAELIQLKQELQDLSKYMDPREIRALAFEGLKRSIFASCWFMDASESDAMWKLYLGNKDGIAIRSSYKRLISCLKQDTPDIYVGKIQYIDYVNDAIPGPDMNDIFSFIRPFMYKRSSFKHEEELRAMFHELPSPNDENNYLELLAVARSKRCTGRPVGVDLKTLIEEVYIPPMSSSSFQNLIELILNSHGLDSIQVKSSSLDEDPVLVYKTMSQSLGWD